MYLTERPHCGFVGPVYHDDDFDWAVGLGEGAFHRSANKVRSVSRGNYNADRLSEVATYGRYPFCGIPSISGSSVGSLDSFKDRLSVLNPGGSASIPKAGGPKRRQPSW